MPFWSLLITCRSPPCPDEGTRHASAADDVCTGICQALLVRRHHGCHSLDDMPYTSNINTSSSPPSAVSFSAPQYLQLTSLFNIARIANSSPSFVVKYIYPPTKLDKPQSEYQRMAHGKHLSRSSHFGTNPEEIDDDDGYGTRTPTLCSAAGSIAPSPAMAHAVLSIANTSNTAVQAYIQRERSTHAAALEAQTRHGIAAGYATGPDWNPMESLWAASMSSHSYGNGNSPKTAPTVGSPIGYQYWEGTSISSSPDSTRTATPTSTSFRRTQHYPRAWTRNQAVQGTPTRRPDHTSGMMTFRPGSRAGYCTPVSKGYADTNSYGAGGGQVHAGTRAGGPW